MLAINICVIVAIGQQPAGGSSRQALLRRNGARTSPVGSLAVNETPAALLPGWPKVQLFPITARVTMSHDR